MHRGNYFHRIWPAGNLNGSEFYLVPRQQAGPMTCGTHRDYLLINLQRIGFILPAPRPELQQYIELFNQTLRFSDTLWWIIDYKADPGVFRCSKQMVEVFELDDTTDRHSMSSPAQLLGTTDIRWPNSLPGRKSLMNTTDY